jgi:hypothetical protein
MKTNGKHEVIARIAAPGLVLATLLAMVLVSSIAGRAQSSTTSPAVPAATPTKAAPAGQVAQPAAPSERQPKGNHEGIKVHGHWTIEVRNPDGKLVSHTEFENSLDTNGAETLSDVLLGLAGPGGYVVFLNSSGFASGPCQPISLRSATGVTECVLIGSLISPEPASFGGWTTECGGTGFTNQITASGPCFPLSISASGSGGLSITGTAMASSTVSITQVSVGPLLCGYTTASPGEGIASPNACAQGGGGVIAYEAELTRATLTTPVTISAVGQLISVNVQISFGSGS